MPLRDAPHAARAGLSRRALLGAAGASAALASPVLAVEPCPDELDQQLSMHQYRLQFQSWSGVVRRTGGPAGGDGTHFVSHCVRNASSSVVFVDWKGAGLAGYADDSRPLFSYRTYGHGEFTRQTTDFWYGSRPTLRDTEIVVPKQNAIGFDVPHLSVGAFNLPNETLVRAAWGSGVSAEENLANLRARTEKAGASELMRASLWFSVKLEKGDRAETPARATYHGSCAIDTSGSTLTDQLGLRLAMDGAHRAVFGSAAARPLNLGSGRVSDQFGASVDLGARPAASLVLAPTRLMIVGPDGTTPIASIGVGVIA